MFSNEPLNIDTDPWASHVLEGGVLDTMGTRSGSRSARRAHEHSTLAVGTARTASARASAAAGPRTWRTSPMRGRRRTAPADTRHSCSSPW